MLCQYCSAIFKHERNLSDECQNYPNNRPKKFKYFPSTSILKRNAQSQPVTCRLCSLLWAGLSEGQRAAICGDADTQESRTLKASQDNCATYHFGPSETHAVRAGSYTLHCEFPTSRAVSPDEFIKWVDPEPHITKEIELIDVKGGTTHSEREVAVLMSRRADSHGDRGAGDRKGSAGRSNAVGSELAACRLVDQQVQYIARHV